MKNKKGFTLIELLVVIAIIGLLSTLAIVSLNTARQKSRDTKKMADVRTLQSAVELYINENGTLPAVPATWAGLATTLGAYLSSGNTPTPPTTGQTACNGNTMVGNCYTYCTNGTVYMLGTLLEGTSTGGTTANTAYAIDACRSSDNNNNDAALATTWCDPAVNAGRFCLGK